MNGIRAYCLLLLMVTVCLLPSCRKEEGTRVNKARLVPVQMALSVGQEDNSTKGKPSIITEMSKKVTFRGMTGITIIPFEVSGSIEADDSCAYYPSRLSDITCYTYPKAIGAGGTYVDGLVENNHSHLYPSGSVSFPIGTASVLAYGYAPTAEAENEIRSRHLNGALNAFGLGREETMSSAQDVYFEPVPIFSNNSLPAQAQNLADVLNAILVPDNPSIHEIQYTAHFWYEDKNHEWQEGSTNVVWNEEIEEVLLRECYLETTNSGHLTPGCGRSVEYMIGRLYRRLKTHVIQNDTPYEYMHSGVLYEAMKENGGTEPLTWGDLFNGLKSMLIDKIEALDNGVLSVDKTQNIVELSSDNLRNYPGNLGLPEGAATLRWSGTRFYPVADLNENPEEGVAPVKSYCYPPRLWYYANTTISTSSSDKSEAYNNETTWSAILSEYRYGKTVSGSTRSVALDQPLKFSCGLLVATVIAATEDLDDGDDVPGTSIHLEDNTFPVTGVVIGSQQKLNFDFTPSGGQSYFLYDDSFPEDLQLPVPSEKPDTLYSFVSQTPAGEPVYLCLELRNNSGQSFTGADGIVLPGSRFYLVGKIEAPSSVGSVFQKHSTTTIHCTVVSLKDALNAIPNLEKPHISLGVRIKADWTMATPGHIILS